MECAIIYEIYFVGGCTVRIIENEFSVASSEAAREARRTVSEMNLVLEWIIEIAVGVVLALLLRRFVCMFVIVKGRSMLDTLRNGDILFALRRGLCGGMWRFDVVLCRYPNRKQLFVKRIVALPGERVAIEEGVLMINGAPQEEPFSLRPCRRDMAERTLGEGEYFVLGDNRASSHDSRSVGPIAQEKIVAVARCIVFPPRRIRRIR